MACTDLFLVIKRRNNTPVFREGLGGEWAPREQQIFPPACPCLLSPVAKELEPLYLSLQPCGFVSQWRKHPVPLVVGSPAAASAPQGGLLHPAPAACRGPVVFILFWGCRNIPAAVLQPLTTGALWKMPSKCQASVREGGGNPPPVIIFSRLSSLGVALAIIGL